MKVIRSRRSDVAIAVAGACLISASLFAQGPWPRLLHGSECGSAPGPAADADVGDLNCLPQAKRVELLTQPVAQAALAPLDRDYRLHSALHQLKAREAEALAMADPSASHPLDAYLSGRAIESRRSHALRETRQELARSQRRVVSMSANLMIATRAATDWIRRQPGRDLPPAYRKHIMAAAAAILAENGRRQSLAEACEEVDRDFDRKLNQTLTLRDEGPPTPSDKPAVSLRREAPPQAPMMWSGTAGEAGNDTRS